MLNKHKSDILAPSKYSYLGSVSFISIAHFIIHFMALQVLSKEVGEGVNMSSLLGTASGWRGRAQQIITLQNKVVVNLYVNTFIVFMDMQSLHSTNSYRWSTLIEQSLWVCVTISATDTCT